MKQLRTDTGTTPAAEAARYPRSIWLSPAAAWATTGTAFLAAQAWVITRWLTHAELTTVPVNGHGISPAQKTVFAICEALSWWP
ncbi:hypothetical protein AB5J72_40805 [Streptomyces sp. CG1]|uniref:hypothetical protein n=1 Tax=Streptomyces sp. CG1 TaxID=1287523 RepID=UPI0034E24DED